MTATGPMSSRYDPAEFWNKRLTADPSLRGTGHRAFSPIYNELLYAAQAEALTDLLHKWQIDLSGAAVLDAGSGVGFYVAFFQSLGAREVVGLDIAEASIHHLQSRFPGYAFYEADIGSPHIPLDRQFDFVCAISVLYHLTDDIRFENALQNLARSTKLGGCLVVSDQFVTRRFSPRHVRFRSLNSYADRLKASGMEVVDVAPIYYLMNRVFVPVLGPRLLGTSRIAHTLSRVDQRWRRAGRPNGSNMKFLLARRTTLAG